MKLPVERVRAALLTLLRLARILASRLSGTGLQFGAQVAAGRILGPAAVGYLGVAQGYILLFGTLAGLGLPTFILRRLSPKSTRIGLTTHTKAEANWLWFAVVMTALGSVVCAAAFGGYWLLVTRAETQKESALICAVIAVGIVAYAYAKLFAEYLKGRGRPAAGLTVEFTAPYACSLLFTLPLWLFDMGSFGVLMPTIGFVFAFMIATSLLAKRIEIPKIWNAGHMMRRVRRSWTELLGLLVVQIGNQLSFTLPVAMIFAFSNPVKAGILVIILRLTGLAATITSIFSAYFSPGVVSAHRSGNFENMRKLYLSSALLNGTACATVCLIIIIFPGFFLGLFGSHFLNDEALLALTITAGARIIRHYLGLTEVFLTLTGNAKFDVTSQTISLLSLAVGMVLTVYTGHADNLIWTATAVAVSSLVRPVISVAIIASRKGLLRA